jgi:hypothetical protein
VNGGVATRPPAQAPRSTREAGTRRPERGATFLSIAVLLVVVSLSMADGLLLDVVAYERDTTVFYYPLMRWVGQQLHLGVLPLWTPQVFGGYPIFADGEIGLAYPPALLSLLLLAPERAFVFLRLLHLWIAAVGTFSLARAWRLPRSAAVLAGLVFALGNFLQAQIHHENIVRTAAWLPVILVLVELGLRSRGWATRASWIVFAALALGMAGLGLHSQMLAIDLLALASYGALRLWIGPLGDPDSDSASDAGPDRMAWWRRLGTVAAVCAPVVVLGLALAAVQLVPLLELASFSPRGSGIPYTESAAYSLTPYGLLQLVFPFVFRGPGNLQWGLWTHWESYLYVGLAPLVLAAVGLLCVRRREVLGWGVLAGVGAIVALGQYSALNLHYLLWLLPGLSGLRAPGRFTIVVVLALAMLAAYGLAWLQHDAAPTRDASARRAVRGVAAAALGLALGVPGVHVLIGVWSAQTQAAIELAYLVLSRDSYPLTQADVYAGLRWATDLGNPHVQIALGGLLVLAGLLGAWQIGPWRGLRSWSGWSSLLVALTAVDLLVFAWGIHPRASLAKLAHEPPAVRALERITLQAAEPSRVLAAPVLNQVSADRLAPFGLQDANGYSSLQFAWHREFLGRVLEVDDDLLDLWNVRYVIDPAVMGSLPSYRGVSFMAGQMLLHSPADTATGTASFALKAGSTVAELRLVTALMAAVDVQQDTPVAELELYGPNAESVARAQLLAGRDTMEWSWDNAGARPHVRHQRVEVAGLAFEGSGGNSERLLSFASVHLDQPVAASTLVIRAILPSGELAVFGGGVVDDQGSIQQLFGRTKAKYRPIYSDAEMRIFENTAALPRAFLVTRARWAPSIGASLEEMSQRPFDPRQEVILAADTAHEIAAHLPPPSAGAVFPNGRADIIAYGANGIRLRTTSSTDALLIVSDTYYPGWRAFVDGQEAPLVRGDLLFRVVPVDAGEHDVELRFEPASVRWGLLVSGVALLCALGVLIVAGRARARGRTT